MMSHPSLDKVPSSESMPNHLSMREIFTWEIAALVSLILFGMTMQIGGGLLGIAVHREVNNGIHSTHWVSPTCSDAKITRR